MIITMATTVSRIEKPADEAKPLTVLFSLFIVITGFLKSIFHAWLIYMLIYTGRYFEQNRADCSCKPAAFLASDFWCKSAEALPSVTVLVLASPLVTV